MQPTFFINHGGGPCFFLDPGPMRDSWSALEHYLRGFMSRLREKPSAIVVVSGHWAERVPSVNAGAAPPLLYDYSGFPPHTYDLTWPAPGAPSLAGRIRAGLAEMGIASGTETRRGFDHGVFVPFKVMMPEAELPVVQVSMQRDFDPAFHLALGRALAKLRREGVLIVGSGQSYHNMSRFFGRGPDRGAEAFDAWLRDVVTDPNGRDAALTHWASAPGARDAHPHEDHLLPLMVVAGAATGEPGVVDFHGHALGKPISGFRFG
ncbi:DODA-type extradiol aromatic ring-opening family dioxygenase [Nguyenibacter vanlangensis]|uniref:Dioxygenase n=1 Tax=Nguyenibacter vanlangensis TaxID=1216886 RepID=A0A7Y7M4E7_9PROT|nr:class III extradiol ring-cleavage dioxygenase [Nguyenibacter vanlangensis]NVN09907.1 dioxygenase [Nguyenibacter vanlangensis]